ncbi:cd7 antigen-like [Aplochiton taeniatus]
MTINLTLLHLQPEDSAFYSCEILLADRPGSSTVLGKHVFFVSVQGDRCGCSSYATLLYVTSAAVGLLLIFFIVLVVHYRAKSDTHSKPQTTIPIYEEMVGLRTSKQKVPSLHLEEMDTTLYSNTTEKFRPGNHYESSQVAPLGELSKSDKQLCMSDPF